MPISRIAIAGLLLLTACSASPSASSPASPGTLPSASASTSMPSPSATTTETEAPSVAPSAELLSSTTEPASEAPAGSVEIEMFGPPPQFREETYVTSAGEAVFFLQNTSPDVPHGRHALAIGPELGSAVAVSDEVRGGRSAIFTVQGLEAGTYVIWCPYLNHSDLGQVGTLTVQ